MNIANNTDVYIAALEELGWTVVQCQSKELEITEWLEERLGEECDYNIFDTQDIKGAWEHLGTGEYLIRDRDVAILLKLTHG